MSPDQIKKFYIEHKTFVEKSDVPAYAKKVTRFNLKGTVWDYYLRNHKGYGYIPHLVTSILILLVLVSSWCSFISNTRGSITLNTDFESNQKFSGYTGSYGSNLAYSVIKLPNKVQSVDYVIIVESGWSVSEIKDYMRYGVSWVINNDPVTNIQTMTINADSAWLLFIDSLESFELVISRPIENWVLGLARIYDQITFFGSEVAILICFLGLIQYLRNKKPE